MAAESSDVEFVALAHSAWEAVATSDVERLREILAPNVVWHATGRNPWKGDHRGFDRVVDYLVLIGERTDRFDANLVDVLASDQRILIIFDVTVAVGAMALDVGYQLLARMDAGRAVEVWTSPLDPGAIEAFWQKALH